jgi:Flp pilus assembly protein TadG
VTRASKEPRRRRHNHGDSGSVTLELTVIFPLFILLLFGAVQVATLYYARQTALGAAQEAVHAARVDGGSLAAGRDAADSFVARAGKDWLTEVRIIDAGSNTSEVRIRVTGKAISVIPGKTWSVSQEAAGARERPAR